LDDISPEIDGSSSIVMTLIKVQWIF
jgi:hypothetical protein